MNSGLISRIKAPYFLLFGILTTTAAHLTISMDLVGWIAYVPFLIYLHRTKGVGSRLLFTAALIASWSVCIAKIVTPPMPFLMVFLYAIPISLFHLPGYFIWDKYKGHQWASFLFPAIMVIMEWLQYTYTPLASWGVAAYTQMHTISMMQFVSIFGMAGLGFLIYWVNCSIAHILANGRTGFLTFKLPIIVALSVLLFGSVRYDLSKSRGKETIKVAAVGTDSEIQGFPLPSKDVNDIVKRNLFDRTEIAANSGASLIVWNEASTFIFPDEEKAWADSLSKLSGRLRVPIVAAFIVPISESPARYENKYFFFDSTGRLIYTYHKHQPVPGEPARNGQEKLEVFEVGGTKTGAVICYDYDFPYLAKEYGALGADIVADPSSDWRGIDPLHSRMAAFRAVEQGHSIIRSTRFGLSAAISPYGEFVSQMSSYDKNDKIMLAHLPVKHVRTIHSVIGDSFVYLCIGFVVLFFLTATFRKPNK